MLRERSEEEEQYDRLRQWYDLAGSEPPMGLVRSDSDSWSQQSPPDEEDESEEASEGAESMDNLVSVDRVRVSITDGRNICSGVGTDPSMVRRCLLEAALILLGIRT